LAEAYRDAIMWILFVRAPRCAAPYWPGRRGLAVLDALVWPSLWLAAIANAPLSTGIVGRAAVALAVALALRRVYRALWNNDHYWFTTWRWGAPVAALLLVGAMMKLMS